MKAQSLLFLPPRPQTVPLPHSGPVSCLSSSPPGPQTMSRAHSASGADAEKGRQLQVVAAGHAEAQPGPSQPGPQQGFTQIPTQIFACMHASRPDG